jgi:hypothetical protein
MLNRTYQKKLLMLTLTVDIYNHVKIVKIIPMKFPPTPHPPLIGLSNI